MATFPDLPAYTAHIDGARIHYTAAGSGELVVLLHGSLCDYRYWRWQVPRLSEQFRVVAPSLPGCWPEAIGPDVADAGGPAVETATQAPDALYSMDNHVRMVRALADALSREQPIHLLGHSRGAQVALEAALAMPGRVKRLVLADPGVPFAGEPRTLPAHGRIAARLGHEPLDDVIGDFVDAVNGPGTWRQTVSWFKDMVRANAWTLVPQLRDIDRDVDPDAVKVGLQCPVLLVGGESSPARYGSRIDRLAALLPRARREIIPRAAHGMNLANARHFNETVARFLAESQEVSDPR